MARRAAAPIKALILAGGLGTRLRPLTFAIPKPLVPIGETPIIELIIRHLKKYKVETIYVSTNYKSEILKLFLGNGDRWGVSIKYIDEETRLGTAGPIGMIDLPGDEDLLVMNGDILTALNVERMVKFHRTHKAEFTVGTVQHRTKSRFGEIQTDPSGHAIFGIREKPVHTATISAGIYICSMKARKFITRGAHLDMPDLITQLIKAERAVVAYPIRERWKAIEKLSDFRKAHEASQ